MKPVPKFSATGLQACANVDPDIFYPVRYSSNHAERARRICSICPFTITCAQWAITSGEPEGIWGGLTPDERRDIRAKVGKLQRG